MYFRSYLYQHVSIVSQLAWSCICTSENMNANQGRARNDLFLPVKQCGKYKCSCSNLGLMVRASAIMHKHSRVCKPSLIDSINIISSLLTSQVIVSSCCRVTSKTQPAQIAATYVVNHNVIQTIMSYGPKHHTLALPKCHTRFSQRLHFSSLWFYDLLHSVDQHTYVEDRNMRWPSNGHYNAS